jgi:adenylate kinase
VIVLLGPTGAGKGTQADRLSSGLGIPSISTGEMMRQECRSGSARGAQVQSLLAAGQLVKDELIQEVVAGRLARPDCAQGCILDGFPRTAEQARFLDRLLDKLRFLGPIVFDLVVAPDELIARLSSRRHCPSCDRTFQAAPGMSGGCPHDGATLVLRADDQPATVRHRLKIYAHHSSEIVGYYQNRGYHSISASQPVEEITERILRILSNDPNGTKEFKLPVLASQNICAFNNVAG